MNVIDIESPPIPYSLVLEKILCQMECMEMTPNQDIYLSFTMDQEQGFKEDGKM